MIPNRPFYYGFIRASIWGLQAVAPAAACYSVARLLGYSFLPRPLEFLAYAEALFYVGVSLPRQWVLHKSRPRPVHRSRKERQELFERSWASIPDHEAFLRVYFKGAPLESIYRDNLKDFLAWGWFYKTKASVDDDDELESFVCQIERDLGRTFQDGRGPCEPLRVSTDPLRIQHKPLFFYAFAVGADDLMTYVTSRFIGLQHYRLPLREFFSVFPFRPHTLFTTHESPSKELSYWHRPHTSRTRLPVLFIHGIGAGFRTYTGFFRDFIQQDTAEDGQTGIIAIELMQISMRITKGMPPRTEMLAEIMKILEHHGWDKFTLMGHSYGTIIARHLVQHLEHTDRIGPMVLVDPVTLSIHWGDIPYNFLYRAPRKASEWQLQYFASTDMCVAHTLTRRFDWTENVMWREEMRSRTVAVVLSGEDIILDPYALQKYLSEDEELEARSYKAHDLHQYGLQYGRKGVDIVWYDGLNHAEMFDTARDWLPLVKMLHDYCKETK